MRITEVEIDEFAYRLPDVRGLRYDPGSLTEPTGFVLTIRTADGTEGYHRGNMLAGRVLPSVKRAARGLVGRDPLEREGIWNNLWRMDRHTDHLGVGAVDMALWDLAGRHYGESVGALLGGYRDEIPAYASTLSADDAPDGLSSVEAYVSFAEDCRDRSYPGFKAHPFGDPDRDAKLVRALGEAVGDDLDLMLDPSDAYDTFAETLAVGRACDDADFFWYEDPMPASGDSVSLARRLSDQIRTPLLGGEHARTGPTGATNVLAGDVYEFIRADVYLDGGITGAMKIARVAEGFGVDVEFHGSGPATLQCLSAVRNTNYFEHALVHPECEWTNAQALETDVDQPEDGTVSIPDGPGLGVDVDWEFVEERRTGRTVADADGTRSE